MVESNFLNKWFLRDKQQKQLEGECCFQRERSSCNMKAKMGVKDTEKQRATNFHVFLFPVCSTLALLQSFPIVLVGLY